VEKGGTVIVHLNVLTRQDCFVTSPVIVRSVLKPTDRPVLMMVMVHFAKNNTVYKTSLDTNSTLFFHHLAIGLTAVLTTRVACP
jgi:hypothetical protein